MTTHTFLPKKNYKKKFDLYAGHPASIFFYWRNIRYYMGAFDNAWSVLKMRFQDLRREQKGLEGEVRRRHVESMKRNDAANTKFRGAPPTPQMLGQAGYPPTVTDETKQDIMSYLVRQQMERNKEAGRIADNTDDAFAGM